MAQSELIVPVSAAGWRIDRFLGEQQAVGSRSAAVRLIADGAVLLDGRRPVKSTRLEAGQRLLLELPESTPPAELPQADFRIVHQDEHLLVVDKPAGVVVHPAPGHRHGTLSQALTGIAGGGDPARPGIVHRLDKDTSGLLVVARGEQTLRELQRMLAERSVERRYTALVVGTPDSSSGTIDAPLGRSSRDPETIAVREGSGRDAVTHFTVLEQIGRRTLLEVRLETGRTHQIRVHLAAISLPVSGDPRYGVAGDLGLARQFLHASELRFTHPVDGTALTFRSELPPELAEALQQARSGR